MWSGKGQIDLSNCEDLYLEYQTAEGQIRQLVDKWDESIGPQMGQM